MKCIDIQKASLNDHVMKDDTGDLAGELASDNLRPGHHQGAQCQGDKSNKFVHAGGDVYRSEESWRERTQSIQHLLRRLRRTFVFARAAWFSARKASLAGHFSTIFLPQRFVTFIGEVRQIVRALRLAAARQVDRRPGSLWWKRMRVCAACPVYDRHLKTCGYTRNLESLEGCGCIMPLKNGLPEAQCWLWEQSQGEMGVDF